MSSVTQLDENYKVEVCSLGHPLGDCPARRAGCNNHYAMLNFMLPPWRVRDLAVEMLGDDPEVMEWLSNIEAVLSSDSETRANWP